MSSYHTLIAIILLLNIIQQTRCGMCTTVLIGVMILLTTSCFADPPTMLAFSFPPDPEAGTDIFISCSAYKGSKPISYTWYHNGNEIYPGSGVEIEPNRNALSLSIASAATMHSGNYTCIAKNAYGSDSYSANLNIKGIHGIDLILRERDFISTKNTFLAGPPHWLAKPSDVSVKINDKLELKCNAGGSPKPKISWLKKTAAGIFRSTTFTIDT